MSEIETMDHEEHCMFLAYGDPVYEELDAATESLLALTIIDVPEDDSMCLQR
jgi:hypothetical protein